MYANEVSALEGKWLILFCDGDCRENDRFQDG
jgi:hypothetical protein